jgi:hypothetical protein
MGLSLNGDIISNNLFVKTYEFFIMAGVLKKMDFLKIGLFFCKKPVTRV